MVQIYISFKKQNPFVIFLEYLFITLRINFKAWLKNGFFFFNIMILIQSTGNSRFFHFCLIHFIMSCILSLKIESKTNQDMIDVFVLKHSFKVSYLLINESYIPFENWMEAFEPLIFVKVFLSSHKLCVFCKLIKKYNLFFFFVGILRKIVNICFHSCMCRRQFFDND